MIKTTNKISSVSFKFYNTQTILLSTMVDSLSPRFSYKGIRFVSGKGGRIVGGGKSSFPQLSLGISTFFPLFASTSVPLIPFLKTVPRRLTATVSRFRPPGPGSEKKFSTSIENTISLGRLIRPKRDEK